MLSKKSNKIRILLSVTALLVILAVGVGITYSWIEGGNSFSMLTEENSPLKTDILPTSVSYKGTVNLDPVGSTTLNLTDYDETSSQYKSLCFSPASSADGKNFFFPDAYGADGKPASYRNANTNDIGTKFISFNFNVKATAKCFLAFNGKPTISVERGGVPVADASAFRIMISDGTESGTHIFSTASTVQESEAVTNVNGAKTTLTTETFDNYLLDANSDPKHSLYSFAKNGTGNIAVAVWLDEAASASSDLFGCDVEIDISLVVKEPTHPVTFNAVSFDNSGNKLDNGFTGGTVNNNSNQFTLYVKEDKTFSVTAKANDNYDFVAWYSDPECTDKVADTAVLSKTVTGAATYYAKFTEKPKYTISVEKNIVPSGGTGGNISVSQGITTGTSGSYYRDSFVTLTARAASGYIFSGWYDNPQCTGTALNSGRTQVEIKVSKNATYYAKFVKSYSVEFISHVDGVVDYNADCYVGFAENPDAVSVSGSFVYESKVTLYAGCSSGYALKGIYDADNNLINSTSPCEVEVKGNMTYYAEFEKLPSVVTTLYAETRADFNKYNFYAYQKEGTTTWHFTGTETTSTNNWPGVEATLDSQTGLYKFVFETERTGQFNVIISDNGAKQYPAINKEGLVGTLGGTYIFTADNTLVSFDPDAEITVNVSASTGGTAKVNGGTTAQVVNGGTVSLSAVPASGYNFDGWYTDSDYSTTLGTDYLTASQTVSVNGVPGSSVTYYAKFKEAKTTQTVYIGVIKYQAEVAKADSLRVHWWNSTTDGDVTVEALGTKYYYAPGDSYWSGAVQEFTMYKAEVPAEAVNIKPFAYTNVPTNTEKRWYGGNYAISNGNCIMIYEYGGNYLGNQITYNP